MTDRRATALGCGSMLISAALTILAMAWLGDVAVQLFRGVAR